MLIVFDLDGTLIDSSKDLAVSMNATRQHLGLEPIDPNLVYSFVGNGVRVLVERALGSAATPELVERGHRFFLSHYQEHALDNTRLYPGIVEMLEKFAPVHTLAVLTNKPAFITERIVSDLQILRFFHTVYGGDTGPAKKPDPAGLIEIIAKTNFSRSQTIMVGDSGIDIQTARNAGVQGYGVLWGFQPESLRESHPDLLVTRPEELLAHVSSPKNTLKTAYN